MSRHNEMRTSKSEDALRHLAQGDMMRYASSGNIRDNGRIDLAQSSRIHEQQRPSNDDRHVRGAAKLAEMSEEVRRRQNRVQHSQQQVSKYVVIQLSDLKLLFYVCYIELFFAASKSW